jgi:BTB/POZ domain
VDRSPKYFGYVLDMLRNGQVDFSGLRPEKVAKIHAELDFYQLFRYF